MSARVAHFRDWLGSRRYALLFFSLLATISIGPLLEAMQFGRLLMEALLVVSLLAAVFPLTLLAQRRALYALIAVAALLRYVSSEYDASVMSLLGTAMLGGVAVLAAYRSVLYSLSSIKVDAEHLYAALSAYLLIGVCWGMAYAAVARFDPNALLLGGAPLPNGVTLADTIYFSFVTLATLGYGDLTPASAVMRGLAIFEAIIGQLYLAIMVARLVGLQTAAHSR